MDTVTRRKVLICNLDTNINDILTKLLNDNDNSSTNILLLTNNNIFDTFIIHSNSYLITMLEIQKFAKNKHLTIDKTNIIKINKDNEEGNSLLIL